MSKTVKRIWNAITTILVSLMVILAFLLWGFPLLGMEVFVVQSGSMEPAYPVGALVYVKETDASKLEAGDVITFEMGGGVRGTHRIIEVVEENGTPAFRTKGDANEIADSSLVAASDLVGKVIFSIPNLGFLVSYIQQPPGIYIAFSAAAVILILLVLPDIIFADKKKQEAAK